MSRANYISCGDLEITMKGVGTLVKEELCQKIVEVRRKSNGNGAGLGGESQGPLFCNQMACEWDFQTLVK